MDNNQSLQNLCNWVSRITKRPDFLLIVFSESDMTSVKNNMIYLSTEIQKSDPYLSRELFELKDTLFCFHKLDAIILGRLIEILSYLWTKQANAENDNWNAIHPRIQTVSKQLYLDGHYANAAEDAFVEINQRVKNIFSIIRPGQKVLDGDSAITHVFSVNNPLLTVCDTSTETGANIQRGTMQLFQGAIAAFRNPKAHTNSLKLSKEDAMRRLMFASMLMYKIDEAILYSNITE